MIKAIVFDLDGTLIDRRKAFLSYCNYLIDQYEPQAPFQVTRDELIHRMVEIDANGYGGLKNFIPKLKDIWELPFTTEEFIRERNRTFSKFSVPMPGACEVLTELKSRYKLGIITNGYSDCQRDKIVAVGIAPYFDDILVSGDVPYEKPDPEIFYLSCSRLKVDPEEMIYVGDYFPNDIAGALAAKIKPIWITEDPDERKEQYDGIRIRKVRDLLKLL